MEESDGRISQRIVDRERWVTRNMSKNRMLSCLSLIHLNPWFMAKVYQMVIKFIWCLRNHLKMMSSLVQVAPPI